MKKLSKVQSGMSIMKEADASKKAESKATESTKLIQKEVSAEV